MIKILPLVSMLFLTSCIAPNISDSFGDSLSSRFMTVFEIRDLTHDQIVGELSGEEITRPPNAWIPLVEVKKLNKTGVSKECLIYKTPFKGHNGILKLVALKENEDCEKLLDPALEFPLIEISNVDQLKMQYRDFQIDMTYAVDDQKFSKKIMLYNVKQNYEFKLNMKPVRTSLIPGLIVLGNDKATHASRRIGNKYDRQLCHVVDNNCVNLTKNNCSECRYGWFSIDSNVCPQGSSKMCGVQKCGGKGEIACPRGISYEQYKMNYHCVDDSPSAYCNEGLRVVCDSKSHLICM